MIIIISPTIKKNPQYWGFFDTASLCMFEFLLITFLNALIMKKITLLFFLFCVLYQLKAQIVWQNTIGGSGFDFLEDIISTSDGGFLLIGVSESGISGDKTQSNLGQGDFWVVKTNSTGVVQWEKTFGGTGDDYAVTAIETTDGGFVIIGDSDSNSSGDKSQNSKGGLDFWIIKINSTGTKLWDKTIGGSLDDLPIALQETATGDIIIGGESESSISGDKTENSKGGSDLWIVKINSTGTIIWNKTFGGNADDFLTTLKLTADGGFIIGASSSSGISGDKSENTLGLEDYWVLKINNTNTIDWQKTIGGAATSRSTLSDLILTSDGSYVIAGDSDSGIGGSKTIITNGGNDLWLLKLNSSGVIQWQNSIGGADDEYFPTLVQKPDGSYAVAGESLSNISGDKTENSHNDSNDIWLVALDANGNVTNDKILGTNGIEGTERILLTSDGNFVISSYVDELSGDNTEAPNGDTDFWILKIDKNTLSTLTINVVNNLIVLYPNPAKDKINISLSNTLNSVTAKVYDVTGKLILSKNLNSAESQIDISQLQTGIYFIKIETENASTTKRFIKQ